MIERLRSVERDELLGRAGARLAFLVPSLGAAPADEDASQRARFDVFEAATTWLQRFSRPAPVLLVIDDLEDADDTTLELLEFVASRLHEMHVLLLGNARTSAIEQGHPLFATLARLTRLPHFERITLTGLDAGETRRFVATVAPHALSDAEIDSMRARTDGNPFLLSLLARPLSDATARSPIRSRASRRWSATGSAAPCSPCRGTASSACRRRCDRSRLRGCDRRHDGRARLSEVRGGTRGGAPCGSARRARAALLPLRAQPPAGGDLRRPPAGPAIRAASARRRCDAGEARRTSCSPRSRAT